MSLAAPRVVTISDLRRLARARLPASVFGYLDGAADDEVTLRDSEAAYREVWFKPRFAVAVPACDLSVTVLGHKLDLPFLLAPIGYSRLMHPRGELAASAAAGRAGTAYILSTMSGHRIEDVKAQSPGPTFYQLYLAGGRGAAEGAIARAKAAGYTALFVTIDTPVAGNRERDVRNGMKELMGKNPFAKLPYIPNILAHPRWLASFIADGMTRPFPNIIIPGKGPLEAIDVAAALESAQVSWTDLKWIRDAWGGPIVIKGVITVDDARRAVDHGAEGIVVSTHAGRQLDTCPASIRVLPGVVDAVKGKTTILFDGGIRRGSHIVKAIAMGADACLLGRGYAYGMAAAGLPGIERAIEIFIADVIRTLKLLGCPSIAALDRSYISLKHGFRAD
ncbi:MAG: alpha-hydroxy-acid oxidizing enzyme [Alphaproteobacteria bacterium 64-11]|nr:alpha-hydroxy-acid oxidizing protein [Alphaproteobacteria bacterium]OJU08622.1 MAG: alpha-hydroxy-acid oxidizing enzyme [Alphaproteobacteria bacterium 64-11]